MRNFVIPGILLAALLGTNAAVPPKGAQIHRPDAEPDRQEVKVSKVNSSGTQAVKSFDRTLRKKAHLNYLLHIPRDYWSDRTRRWPLMLFLHGAGERGLDPNKVKVHGPPKIADTNADFPFILVSPQCPPGKTWDNDSLNALLDEVIEQYRIDSDRVYLTGLSMGGFGSWSLALNYPERFAAVVPICGGGNLIDALLSDKKRSQALKELPFWVFHGAKDPVVKVEESERMVNALKRIGSPVQLTIYPEANHDSWTETYANPKLYEWLLQQRRKPALVE